MVTLAARPEPVTIDLDQTAVMVVDMQNAFATSGGMFDLAGVDISGAAPVIEVHRRLLDAARTAEVPVIYLQMGYKPDLSDAGGALSPNHHKELALVVMRDRPQLHGKLLVRDTWDWQIVDELMPQAGDIIINKTRYSGFCGTDLAQTLRAKNIRYLLFTGIATNICVESTARDAYFEEFWPIMVEDAMNHSGPNFCQESTLWNFEHVFGWVTNSAALLETLEAAAD